IDALAERPSATAIFVDYDGSLAPIVDLPGDAVALPAAIEALHGLTGLLGRVGIVSGRPLDFLVRQVDMPGLVLAGLYGMEVRVNGSRIVDPRVGPYGDSVGGAGGRGRAVRRRGRGRGGRGRSAVARRDRRAKVGRQRDPALAHGP